MLAAGYEEIEEATRDFESLVRLVRDRRVSIEAAILVTHAEDGSVSVRQTGDNLGRKGWVGAAGSGSRWLVRAARATDDNSIEFRPVHMELK